METLLVSKAVYDDIMRRRIGREAISTTLLRELKPYDCEIRDELETLRRQKGSSLSEVEKRLGL